MARTEKVRYAHIGHEEMTGYSLFQFSIKIQFDWGCDMPSVPSGPDRSLQSDGLVKFGNLGKVDGTLQRLDCLTQMQKDCRCC